jgi:hypothetical protein
MGTKEKNALICERLFACDTMIYEHTAPEVTYKSDMDDLKNEMARLRVSKSLVRHGGSLKTDPGFCNEDLKRKTKREGTLVPVWFISPGRKGADFSFADFKKNNIKAVWTDPASANAPLQSWIWKDTLDAVQERRAPLLLSHKSASPGEIHQIMTDFPRMRVILLDLPRLGRQPAVEALLKAHSELFLCFNPSFSVHGGYKDLCARHGSHRWVWGWGYPSAEGGAGLTGLVYSGMSGPEMRAAAFENIERLLSEVRQ